jgi:predicted AAA+ superfamily ATPase
LHRATEHLQRDDEFMADLSRVVNNTAPEDYLNPAAFFAKSYPTRGMKELLKAVCLRLSGKGGEVSSIIRLGTQYGGGKTHGLIALVHAVRGAKGVPNLADFVDPSILPSGVVRIAALDGENADPANGLTLEPGLLARSLWGEMAYRLAGREGYERVRQSDERHIAPGAETIRELFGGQPTLILLDEISVYLRKVERAFPDARSNSPPSFTTSSRRWHRRRRSLWFTRWRSARMIRGTTHIRMRMSARQPPWRRPKASPSAARLR